MRDLLFEEIETKFNDALEKIEITESSAQSAVKRDIFYVLKKAFPTLNIQEIDSNYNKIKLEVEYTNNYLHLTPYDTGKVTLIFAIKTKRTDRLVEVSKTKKKYIHEKHKQPITFERYGISSWIKKFDWKTEEPKELCITSEKWEHQNSEAEKVKGGTINELIENIATTYENQFRSDIVQPYLKQLFVMGYKREDILTILPKELVEAIEQRDNEKIFNGLADFIINKEMISS